MITNMLINGKWEEGSWKMDVFDPYDQSLITQVSAATVEDMERAIQAAEKAFESSRKMPAWRRMEILRKAAEGIEQRHEEFSQTLAREGIKTIREARKEITRAVDTMRISAEAARQVKGETIAFDQLQSGERRSGYYTREPIGIIAAITPFNDPVNLVCHKVGPALASGNVVIVKPHEETPLTALLLADVLVNAGLPEGFMQVLPGKGEEIGACLVKDKRVRMVSFTGGVKTGQTISRQAGLKKIAMELGSNCPNIVTDTADLSMAIPSIVSGAFWAAGQNCLHVQRLYLQKKIYQPFVEGFVKAAEAYKTGNKLDEQTDMGPIINEKEADRIEKWIQNAVKQGARLLTGGKRTAKTIIQPTLIKDVPMDCELAVEEVYGPVTMVQSYDTLDEAVELANATNYGLQAAIFTEELSSAFKAVQELDYGAVMVNESTDYRIDAMPFGGTKQSGLGREGIQFAIQEMTEPKLVCITL